MERRKKLPNGHWAIYENCLAEASKYETRGEWQKSNPLSYRWASKNGWLEACSAHMVSGRMPDGYWTLDRCKEEAHKFKTKVEWRAGHRASYSAANRGGWIAECTKGMESGGMWFGPAAIAEALLSHDIAYEAEYRFKDQKDIARRPFDFYLPDYKLVIEFHGEQHLIGWGRRSEDAKSIQERDLFKKNWALDRGLNYLEIGQWEAKSKEDVEDIVLSKVFQISKRIGLKPNLSKRALTEEEQKKLVTRLKWTLEACKNEASQYSTIKHWQTGSAGSYNAAHAKGWLDVCTQHMERKLHKRGYWTLEACIDQAKQFTNKSDWSNAPRSGYSIAAKNGWLDLCTAHMPADKRLIPRQRVWTLEKCLELAKTCSTKAGFKKKSASAYQRARVRGWLDQCCAHMEK